MHNRFGSRRIPHPSSLAGVTGIFGGGLGGTITPPFDYELTYIPTETGGVSLSGFASKNSGQLVGNAVTNANAASHGTIYNEVGIYLAPLTGPAKLRVTANPSFWMQWWTNSINTDHDVRSFGSLKLGIWGQLGSLAGSGAVTLPELWDEQATQEVRFDFGSFPGVAASVELEVNPSRVYALFVATVNSVRGAGWPGSLAGSRLSVTVPSISFELEPIAVATPD